MSAKQVRKNMARTRENSIMTRMSPAAFQVSPRRSRLTTLPNVKPKQAPISSQKRD